MEVEATNSSSSSKDSNKKQKRVCSTWCKVVDGGHWLSLRFHLLSLWVRFGRSAVVSSLVWWLNDDEGCRFFGRITDVSELTLLSSIWLSKHDWNYTWHQEGKGSQYEH
jgi:hypothetical protein